jgi:hypothetical protein
MKAPRTTVKTPSKNMGVVLRSEASGVVDRAGQMSVESVEDGLIIEAVKVLRR